MVDTYQYFPTGAGFCTSTSSRYCGYYGDIMVVAWGSRLGARCFWLFLNMHVDQFGCGAWSSKKSRIFKGWEDGHYHAMFARHWSPVMRCLQAPQSECPRHWWTKRMPQGILCHQPCKANGLCEKPSTIHWLVVSSCWRSTGSLRLSRTDPKQPEMASSDGKNYHELNNQHYTFLKRHNSATHQWRAPLRRLAIALRPQLSWTVFVTSEGSRQSNLMDGKRAAARQEGFDM